MSDEDTPRELGTFAVTDGTNATLPDFDFISAIQYASQKLQVKFGHCSGGVISYDQVWTDVFTAIAHSSTVAGSGS